MSKINNICKLLAFSSVLVSCEAKPKQLFKFPYDTGVVIIDPVNQDKYFIEINGDLIDIAYAKHLIAEYEYKLEVYSNNVKY